MLIKTKSLNIPTIKKFKKRKIVMTSFIIGLIVGAWVVGGLWFYKSPRPYLLSNFGCVCALVLSGPIAWILIFWVEFIKPDFRLFKTRARSVLVNEELEKELQYPRKTEV